MTSFFLSNPKLIVKRSPLKQVLGKSSFSRNIKFLWLFLSTEIPFCWMRISLRHNVREKAGKPQQLCH